MSDPLSTRSTVISLLRLEKFSPVHIQGLAKSISQSTASQQLYSKLSITRLSSLNQKFPSWSTALCKPGLSASLVSSTPFGWFGHTNLCSLDSTRSLPAHCFDIQFSLSRNLSPNYCFIRFFFLLSEVLCPLEDIITNNINCGPITFVQWYSTRSIVVLQGTSGSLCR